jgi:hypothetical protein
MYPPHLIVELHTHAAKGLAQRLTSSSSGSSSTTVTADGDSSSSVSTEGWNWSAVDYFLPEDLDSGVLVQVLLVFILVQCRQLAHTCSSTAFLIVYSISNSVEVCAVQAIRWLL